MLKLRKLFIAFDNKKILDNTEFFAYDSQLTVITGESGVGKSSLLNALTLDLLFKGEYTYHDKELDKEFIRQHVYKVEQFPIFINTLDIQGHFDLVLTKKDNTSFVRELGIESLLNNYPNQLSDGEKKRLAIALAVASNKEILILDEPTSSLNEEYIEIVSKLLADFAHSGHTVIVSSHDQMICSYSDCLYNIENLKLEVKKVKDLKKFNRNSVLKYYSFQFKHYITMLMRGFKNKVISKSLNLILISLSLLLIFYNNEAMSYHVNLVNDISSQEIIVYKSVDGEGKIDFSYEDCEYPLSINEINALHELDHVTSLGYHYTYRYKGDLSGVNVNEKIFDGDSSYFSIDEIWYGVTPKINGMELEKNFLPENPEELDEGAIFLRTFDPNFDYSDKLEKKLSDEKGIYLSKSFFERLFPNGVKDEKLSLYFPLLVPMYSIDGLSRLYVQGSEESFPVNTVETKEIWIELPIIGVLKEESLFDNSYQREHLNDIYLDRDLLDMYISEYGPKEPVTAYWVGNTSYINEVPKELEDQVRKVVYKSPWEPSVYLLYVDNIMNINYVLNGLIPLGLDAKSVYIDAISLQAALSGTKSSLSYLGYIVLAFVLMSGFIIKKKDYYLSSQTKQYLGNVGMKEKHIFMFRIKEILLNFGVSLVLVSLLSFVFIQIVRIVFVNNTTYSLSMFGLGILLIFIIEVVFPLFLERKMYKNDKH